MSNRMLINILVLVLIAMGLLGARLSQVTQQNRALLKELEEIKQQAASLTKMVEAARQAEELRRQAEEAKKQADLQQAGAFREEPRLAQGEEQPRREGADKEKAAKGERLRVEQQSQQISEQERGGQQPGRILTIKARIRPETAKSIALAQVHAGDQVTVRIERKDGASEKLLVGMGPGARYQPGDPAASSSSAVRWCAAPLKDHDSFSVSRHLIKDGGSLPGFESPQGITLYLSAAKAPSPDVKAKSKRKSKGYLLITVEIFQDNRWNAAPKSLI